MIDLDVYAFFCLLFFFMIFFWKKFKKIFESLCVYIFYNPKETLLVHLDNQRV